MPTLRVERRLLANGARLVAGMDEVGRGALAGPVCVGIVVVDAATGPAPAGTKDSKLLAASAREDLVEPIRAWATAWAVGHAGPDEVDEGGIMVALRRAAVRALRMLSEAGFEPDAIILDGSHDWLSQGTLLEDGIVSADVVTKVGGDRDCSSVAAASVLAKVERDARMGELDAAYPGYGWAANKGYASPDHIAALGELGASAQHRRSWRLPGQE